MSHYFLFFTFKQSAVMLFLLLKIESIHLFIFTKHETRYRKSNTLFSRTFNTVGKIVIHKQEKKEEMSTREF